MTEEELIARCRKHEIAYTALPPSARRELLALTEQADRHGAAFLTDCSSRLCENCYVNEDACGALYEAIAEVLTHVIDGATACLGTLGDTGRTVSFSVAKTKLSAQALTGLGQLKDTLSVQVRALGLLCRQCYRKLSELALGERACMTCRITGRLIADAAVLCEIRDNELTAALAEQARVWSACGQRREEIRERLEEALRLCERTVPEILMDFRGATVRDEAELTSMMLIRACEQMRTRLSSLRSLLFSKKHA